MTNEDPEAEVQEREDVPGLIPGGHRIGGLAELMGDRPNRSSGRGVWSRKRKIFPTLTTEESDRMFKVFPKARKQFKHLLIKRGLHRVLSADEISDIELEDAAKAVRGAKEGLTAAYMSTSMRYVLERYWGSRSKFVNFDALPGRVILEGRKRLEEAQHVPRPQEGAPLNIEISSTVPTATRKLLLALRATGAKPKDWARLLPYPADATLTNRQVNRIVQQFQRDFAYKHRTGHARDRQLWKALLRCISDETRREALYLHLTYAMSTRELGKKYGVSNATVHNWLGNDTQELKAYLRHHGPQDLLETLPASS